MAAWSIPPGPSEEELVELEDEEGEHLHNILEPFLEELKGAKKRLRELRQKRLEAAVARSRQEAGTSALVGQLPAGFWLEEGAPGAEPPAAPAAAPAAEPSAERPEWQAKKEAADRAFKDKDWNTALSLYGEALKTGGGDLDDAQCATLLSNRALV